MGKPIEYSNRIQFRAQQLANCAIVDNDDFSNEERIEIRHTWAIQLAEETGCTMVTARQHITRALRRQRAPDWSAPEEHYHSNARGGAREGSGRQSAQEYPIDITIPRQRGEWRLERRGARGYELIQSLPATGGAYRTVVRTGFYRETTWAEDGTKLIKLWKLTQHGEVAVMKHWADE